MAFRFVEPATVRLDLGDGDWIEVAKELSNFEIKQMRTAGLTYMQGDRASEDEVKLGVAWSKMAFARVMAWVKDWNAKDAQGRPLPFNQETVKQLSEDDFNRIEKALNAHIEAQESEKNATAGEKKSETS